MAQKPSLPQGTRDFGPQQVQKRKYILQTIEQVFQTYGFMCLETPTMENLSTLTGKYGDEGDQLLYKILNSGDYLKKINEANPPAAFPLDPKKSLPLLAEKGLRYDLTVPFARYVVMNRNDITFPFKRYQMQPVWRADRPQKGRYREFWQCDADVVGTESLLCEAELISIYDKVFTALGIPVVIRLNNRKILTALAESLGAPELIGTITVAIDKLDKVGIDGVQKELSEKGLNPIQVETISRFLQLPNVKAGLAELVNIIGKNETLSLGSQELTTVLTLLGSSIQNELVLDFTLARGLSYYTGAILEVQATVGTLKSSIGGGGRYDNLTGVFGLTGVSGVGISFGLDRIVDVMEELNLFPPSLRSNAIQVLFCYFGSAEQQYAFEACQHLRSSGIAADIYPEPKKIGKQLDFANALQIPFAAIVGETEMSTGTFNLKNLTTGTQVACDLTKLIEHLRTTE